MFIKFSLLYFFLGLIDYCRNTTLKFNIKNLKNYYLGKGTLTFLLSPINLLSDLFSIQTFKKPVLNISDLNIQTQKELNKLFKIFDDNKDIIINYLNGTNTNNSRNMIMFKWYDKEINNKLKLKGLNINDFKYIKTIGISFFLPHVKTSWHYGPLRCTYRCLYNINKVKDNSYIECGGHINKWKNNPVFIFDDTYIHQSCSDNEERYCAFIDIIRPSYFYYYFYIMINIFGFILESYKQLFYKKWNFM